MLKMVTGRTFQLLWLQNLEALCESSQLRSTEAESGPRTMQIPLPQEDLSTEALMSCHLWAPSKSPSLLVRWAGTGEGQKSLYLPGPTSGLEKSLSAHPREHELHPESYKKRECGIEPQAGAQ